MTSAPPALLEARSIIINALNMSPLQRHEDLEPNEVGIVGDLSHIGGYHCGEDRVRRNSSGVVTDYSVTESDRDRKGLSVYASAIDLGWFEHTIERKVHNLYTFNDWLIGECRKLASDTLDIREVIYSLDGVTVKRWDRLGIRSTGDSSHRTHTHTSYFRDSMGKSAPSLYKRYLSTIGLIDVEQNDSLIYYPERKVGNALADVLKIRNWLVSPPPGDPSPSGAPPVGSVGAIILEAAQRPPITIDPELIKAIINDAVKMAMTDPKTLEMIAEAVADETARRQME